MLFTFYPLTLSKQKYVLDETSRGHQVRSNACGISTGHLYDSESDLVGAVQGTTVAGSTSDPGQWSYQFSSPSSITFDQYGYMYVLDTGNSRVQRWLPGAVYGVTVASATMSSPLGLTIDRLGNMVVVDTSYHRILSFGLMCRKFGTVVSRSVSLSFSF
jgi:hypothetical protein